MEPEIAAELKTCFERARQIGRLEVTGEVNIQRVRALKERYDRLLEHLKAAPDDLLVRKAKRLRKQLLQACEIGVRNEVKLKELNDAWTR